MSSLVKSPVDVLQSERREIKIKLEIAEGFKHPHERTEAVQRLMVINKWLNDYYLKHSFHRP